MGPQGASTQISSQEQGDFFEKEMGGGRRALSPIGSCRTGAPRGLCFITGLYQDEDLRLLAISKEGWLKFRHSPEGDVDLQEHDRNSTNSLSYPPMSDLQSIGLCYTGRKTYIGTNQEKAGSRRRNKNGTENSCRRSRGHPGGRDR